jgi:hypothetical protein
MFFVFFEDFKVAYFFDGFYFSVFILYDVMISCNSSIFNQYTLFIKWRKNWNEILRRVMLTPLVQSSVL